MLLRRQNTLQENVAYDKNDRNLIVLRDLHTFKSFALTRNKIQFAQTELRADPGA